MGEDQKFVASIEKLCEVSTVLEGRADFDSPFVCL